MITSITLENFKCFRKVEVNPRRITAFVGPNGTGKSSVLQALALLKQSVGKNQLNLQGPIVNLSKYEQIQSRFNGNNAPNIAFSGKYSPSPDERQQLGEVVAFEFEVHVREGRDSRQGTFTVVKSEPASIPILILKETKFVPAARGLVQHVYNQSSQVYEDISITNGLSAQEQYTASNLLYIYSVHDKIAEWMKQVTGVALLVHPVPPQAVEVTARGPSGEINIVAEGFGTNALILLFLQLASAAKGATVLIEEPEIHLHPKAQAELASVLVEEAQAEDKQVIMTTHSEHILSRLLTLVAEDRLPADELAIYTFEKDEKGECTAHELEVTEDGKVVGGIKDFFESDLDELERYIRALQSNQ